jgi:hypothetical protein
MKLAALLVLLLQAPAPQAPPPHAPAPQSQAPADEQAPPAEPELPPVDPYPGPLAEGLRELAASSRAGEHPRALELAASLLASGEVGRIAEPQRARLRYDTGLARALAGASGEAVADLRAAAGLAGPGELRAASMYAAGTARLLAAEQLRIAVPEIAKKLGLEPPAPPAGALPLGAPPGGLPMPDPKAPDPIELAKAGYMLARSELLSRLELDWRDADTRANLELVARRLRELDEIERQRKEEQEQQQNQNEQQQQQQQQQNQPPEQDQKPDASQEQQQPPEQPSESEEQPPEQEPGEEQQPEQQPEPSEQDQQQPKPEPGKQEERVLSKEEVQRLLDRLQQIEEQAQALRAMLRERRRVPVEKDW